jgi:hypothetical protein
VELVHLVQREINRVPRHQRLRKEQSRIRVQREHFACAHPLPLHHMDLLQCRLHLCGVTTTP